MSTAPTPGAVCFFKTPENGWVLGKVESADPKDTFTCDADKNGTQGSNQGSLSKLKADSVFVITNTELLDQSPDDLLQLTLLHDSTLMHALNKRYYNDTIYTFIGPIVVAFNPFKYTIPWYQDTKMPDYLAEGDVIKKNKPHSWAVAHNTYYEMVNGAEDQCILVSGESGAGKTEAVKIVLKYLGAVSCLKGNDQQKAAAQAVRTKLLQASPILEGFGNAKTVRNDNSSRFGKFMKVQFDNEGFLVGAFTIKYLLEKSRIVSAGPGERLYHSFYLLTFGADVKKYNAEAPANYKSLNSGGCTKVEKVDDNADYAECLSAMKDVGIEDSEKDSIWSTVAGIMGLLNTEFKPAGETCEIEAKGKEWVSRAATSWQVDGSALEKELLTTTRMARGEKFTKQHTVTAAVDTRDSLVKALYDELFSWLVTKINSTAAVDGSKNFIGLLDIFGFEDFKINSFEQLCINLANETLQHHYNEYIFNKDLEECRAEGIDMTKVEFPDNTPCLKLITDKMGILALLDEECSLGKGTDENFLANVEKNCGKHEFFEKKRLAKTAFIVKHYAGDVSYEITGFLDKNRDTLKDDMKMLMRASKNEFIAKLLPEPVEKSGKKVTVGKFFKDQLGELMAVINHTNPHWIRCIKPHPAKKPLMWHGTLVLNQLLSSGIIGTVKVRKAGFPIRIPFQQFIKRFRLIKPGPVSDPKGKCTEIMAALTGLEAGKAQIGTARVFLKTEAYTALEERLAEDSKKYIIQIQAYVRVMFAGQRYREREFDSNKATIIENFKLQYKTLKAEDNGRKEVEAAWAAENADLWLTFKQEAEEKARKSITDMEDKEWNDLMTDQKIEIDRITAEKVAYEREREAREAATRQECLNLQEDGREAIMDEEDDMFNRIVRAARQEQYDRDKTRDDERRQRSALMEEEAFEWAQLIRAEEDFYQECKHREEMRLAEEWRVLIEGVYSVQEQRKAESVAHEKWKHDIKRQAMTDRRRADYVSTQTTRSVQVASQTANNDRKARAIREWESQRKEADANDIVQRLRVRKDLLVHNETARKDRLDSLRNEAAQDERRSPNSPRGTRGSSPPRGGRSPPRNIGAGAPHTGTGTKTNAPMYYPDKDNLVNSDPYYAAVPPVERQPYYRDSARVGSPLSPRRSAGDSINMTRIPALRTPRGGTSAPIDSPRRGSGIGYGGGAGGSPREDQYGYVNNPIQGMNSRDGYISPRSGPSGGGRHSTPTNTSTWSSPHQYQKNQDQERRAQAAYATGSPLSSPTYTSSPTRRNTGTGFNPHVGAAHRAQAAGGEYGPPPAHARTPPRRTQGAPPLGSSPQQQHGHPGSRIPDPYNNSGGSGGYYENTPPLNQSPRGGYYPPPQHGRSPMRSSPMRTAPPPTSSPRSPNTHYSSPARARTYNEGYGGYEYQ